MKYIVIFLSILLTFNLKAQLKKKNFLLETTFNYSSQKDGGIPLSPLGNATIDIITETKVVDLKTIIGIGFCISPKDAIGASYSYANTKSNLYEKWESTDTTTGMKTITQSVDRDEITVGMSYGIYYRRFIALSKKIFFTPRLDLLHETIKTRTTGISYNGNRDLGTPIGSAPETYIQSNFAIAELSASFLYQINNFIGVQAKIMKGDYRIHYKNTKFPRQETKTKLGFDISPSNWEFGVIFILGAKSK